MALTSLLTQEDCMGRTREYGSERPTLVVLKLQQEKRAAVFTARSQIYLHCRLSQSVLQGPRRSVWQSQSIAQEQRSLCLKSFPSPALPRGWEGFYLWGSPVSPMSTFWQTAISPPLLHFVCTGFCSTHKKAQEGTKGVASLKATIRLFCLGAVTWFCLQMVLKQQTHHSRFKISSMPTDAWLDPSLLRRRQFPSGTVNLVESLQARRPYCLRREVSTLVR